MEEPLIFGGDEEDVIVGGSGPHQRSEPRDSMFLNSTIRHLGTGETWPLRVRNLSSGGLMADCPAALVRGDPVEVELRGVGPQRGKVAWTATSRIGVAFERVIDPTLARRPIGSAQAPILVHKADVRRPGLRSL